MSFWIVAIIAAVACVSFLAILRKPIRSALRDGWLDHLKSETPELRHGKNVSRPSRANTA